MRKHKNKIIVGVVILFLLISSGNSQRIKKESEKSFTTVVADCITTIANSVDIESSSGFIRGGDCNVGWGETKYSGMIGYVDIWHDSEISKTDKFTEIPWQIPIYEKDKQFYVECGTVDHKTKVVVISQDLKHEGYGFYSGYLLVESVEESKKFYINVHNFVNLPYWEGDIIDIQGWCIAEFNQVSDYYPVVGNSSRNMEKVEIEDGTIVLVYGKDNAHPNTNPIRCIVFKEWKYGYGGVDVYFNEEDLSIKY